MKEIQHKKKKRFKIITNIISIFILIIVAATIGIGNYFINYALVPTGGGGNREVVEDNNTSSKEATNKEEDSKTEDSEAVETSTNMDSLIETNRVLQEELAETWKISVSSEEVSITADDGIILRGLKYYPAEKTDKWLILVHGYHSTPDAVLSVGANFSGQGYNVLSISMRAHADSEGDYIGMGWLDRLDILNWIDLIVKENPNAQIVLHGTSMGGAAVLMVSGEELPENVKAIVDDCGYTSVWDIFSSELKVRFNLPEFPVLYMVDLVANSKVGYEFKEASALKQVEKSKTPILFVHGDKDDFVPVNMAYELYDAANCDKDILIVEGASHTEAKYADPTAYYNKVFSFVGEYIK